MEMVIRVLPSKVDITLEKDETRGDIDININEHRIGYFTMGIGVPTLRISRKDLRGVGFQLDVTEV